MKEKKEWFAEWFDSPYYHILYGNRDMDEAEFFLSNLINKYNPGKDVHVIDLACGKGRHSIYLNSLGYDVTGIDLSAHSISLAKPFENNRLHFLVGDLRCINLEPKFDIALNLFTSFGYFEDMDTNLVVLNEISKILKPGGYLLIDFFNARKVVTCLAPVQTKTAGGIEFEISKQLTDGKIIKDIRFEVSGRSYHYQEKVQALNLNDFERMFESTSFSIIELFGSYDLKSFESENSDRLIVLARKSV